MKKGFIFLSLTLLLFSFWPTLYEYYKTPPQRVFLGIHNNILDYPMFISVIFQAQEGHLAQIQKLTSEPQMGTWVHYPYLFFGWLSAPLGPDPVYVYHSMRLILGFILLLSFYKFIRLFFKSKFESILVFFLSTFIGGFPRFKFDQGWHLIDWPYLAEFSGFDVLKRPTFLPHALLRDTLFLLSLVFYVNFVEKKQNKYFIFSVISGLLLGLLSPNHMLIIYIVLNTYFLIQFSLKKIFIYNLLTIPSVLYTFWVFNTTPWNIVKNWEASHQFSLNIIEYSLGLGPFFFFAIPTIFYVIFKVTLKKKFISLKNFILVTVPLLTVFFIFTPIYKPLGLLNFRFLGIPLQVFWGVLGNLYLFSIIKSKKILIAVAIVVFLIISPTYPVSWKMQINEFAPYNAYNIYPDKNMYEGFMWLKKNTNHNKDIVLTDSPFGNLLPGFSGNIVYIGHPVSTIDFLEKKKEIAKFYSNAWSPIDAYKFLKSRRIKYVIWSYAEWYYRGDSGKYKDFLTSRFTNPAMVIFEVK